MSDTAIAELAPVVGVRAACDAVGVAQAGWYRRRRQSPAPQRPAPVPHRDRVQPRALAEAERQQILDELHSDRFVDLSPTEVWAILLDEGRYLGSISTFYRLLREASGTRERRKQATHPASVKPELVTAEPQLRENLTGLSNATLIRRCASLPATAPTDVATAARHTLRRLAQRIQALTTEERQLQQQITTVLTTHAPQLLQRTASDPTAPPSGATRCGPLRQGQ